MSTETDKVEVVAIDGPAASGKSTVASRLAQRLGWSYVDTGAMYRAVTLAAEEAGVDLADLEALAEVSRRVELSFAGDPLDQRVILDGRDVTDAIRRPELTKNVRFVAPRREVRQAMRELQRKLGSKGHVVMEGRDIGTVVFPDAKYKFYLDADLDERARRRLRDLTAAARDATLEDVREELAARDKSDIEREHAPLAAAHDAIRLDTTRMTIDEVVDFLAEYVALHGESEGEAK